MDAKHTPASLFAVPWRARQNYQSAERKALKDASVLDAQGAWIATTGDIQTARLIAAAPDLLACVAGFVDSWGYEVEHDEPISGGDAVEWIAGAMLEFRAALARAKA